MHPRLFLQWTKHLLGVPAGVLQVHDRLCLRRMHQRLLQIEHSVPGLSRGVRELPKHEQLHRVLLKLRYQHLGSGLCYMRGEACANRSLLHHRIHRLACAALLLLHHPRDLLWSRLER